MSDNDRGPCGTCTQCCKFMGISGTLRGRPFKKPAHEWCEQCDIGKGCRVYADRPQACSDFQCLWLQDKLSGPNLMPDELRPDRCRVVFAPTTDETNISVHVDSYRPDDW